MKIDRMDTKEEYYKKVNQKYYREYYYSFQINLDN